MLLAIYIGFVGACIGSFFNVAIFRLPNRRSVLYPASRCPRCAHPLHWYDNIPLLSYVVLRGRCRRCKSPVSMQYPIIEALCAGYLLLLWYSSASEKPPILAEQLSAYWLLMCLVPLSIIDIKHYILPDFFTLSGMVIGLSISFFPGGITPLQSIIGLGAGFGSLYLVGFLGKRITGKKEAMGMGDMKLMGWCGAVLGWQIALGSILAASFLGSIYGIIMIVFKKSTAATRPIAFGPFLAVGIICCYYWGRDMFYWYLSLAGL